MRSKKLKILFVIPYFAPAWGYGGPAKLSYDLGRLLVKKGHQVTVFASDTLDGKSRIEKKHAFIEGMEVFYLPNISNFLAWRKIFLPQGLGPQLEKHIKDFDIIHCFDFRTYQNIQINHYCRKFKKNYILSVLGQTQRASGFRLPIKIIYDSLWGKKIVKEAKFLIAQNENERRDLLAFGAESRQIKVLPLLVNLEEFRNLPTRGSFRKKYKIANDEKVILFVGRLHFYKGVQLLIEVLKRIRLENVKLVIVGRNDGYEAALKNRVRDLQLGDKVIFAGPIYGDDRIRAYVDADIFAFTPIHFEETSLACLEAMATGLPVIVTKQASIPGFKEIKAGFELEPNIDEIAKKTRYLLKHEKERMDFGRNAREFIKNNFSGDKIIYQLEKIYYEVR